tara:strand:- start:84 stop:491 length:408 start_codon:yes stop_codon:yes gene_type:complete
MDRAHSCLPTLGLDLVEVVILCYRSDARGLEALDTWLARCHAEAPDRRPIVLLRLGDPGTAGTTPPGGEGVYAHHELLWTFRGDTYTEELETDCRVCREQMSETFDAVLASAVRAHLPGSPRAAATSDRKRCTIS